MWIKLLAIVGPLVAAASLIFNVYQWRSTEAPHTRFEEVKDKISRLDNRIRDADSVLKSQTGERVDRLEEAKRLLAEAEDAWIKGDYERAERLLEQVSLKVPRFVRGPSPLLPLAFALGFGGVAGIVATIYWVLRRLFRRRQ